MHSHWQTNSHNALGHDHHLKLWSVVQGFSPPSGRPLPCVHPTLHLLRVEKQLSEEDLASPQLWPFPTPHQVPSQAIGPSSCRLVLRFGSRREFPLAPVFSSPTSLYLNPFVSKIPFGVLCLFFPLFHGKLLRMYKYVFSLENRFLYILGLWFLRQAGLQTWRLPRELIPGRPFSFRKTRFFWTSHPLEAPQLLEAPRLQPGLARHLSSHSPWFSKLLSPPPRGDREAGKGIGRLLLA